MNPIVLNEYDMRRAADAARTRYEMAQKNRRNPGLSTAPLLERNILGCQCELAASYGLNLHWQPVIEDGKSFIGSIDVGGLAQVRGIAVLKYSLIIKPDAKDEEPYVLVLQRGRSHELLGWFNAGVAKRTLPLLSGYGDPCHLVKRDLLWNIHTLKRRLHYGIALDEVELEALEDARLQRARVA